jgi:hypothetical protein
MGDQNFPQLIVNVVARDKSASSSFFKTAHHKGSLGFQEFPGGSTAEPPHLSRFYESVRALSRFPYSKMHLKRLMDFDYPIKLQDYHPDTLLRPISSWHSL